MSDEISREYRLTVRLSTEEKAQLDALADRLGLDMSATVRSALQTSYVQTRPMPERGHFVVTGERPATVSIRLSGEVADER